MVRSRTFCCCLPVRFGVFVMSLGGTLAGGALAVLLWLAYKKVSDHPEQYSFDDTQKTALVIEAVLYSLLAVVSIFGFIGAVSRKRACVGLYAFALWIHWGFTVGSGAFFLYKLYHQDNQAEIDKCINGSTNQIAIEACQKGEPIVAAAARTAVTIVLVILFLFELWGCVIAQNYSGQLADEEDERTRHDAPPAVVVQQVAVVVQQVAAAPPTTYNSYAFDQAPNAYGNKSYA